MNALDEDDSLKPFEDQQHIKGSLCFSESKISDPYTIEKFNVASTDDYESLHSKNFEERFPISYHVDSARIIVKDGQKYVAYTIFLSRSRGSKQGVGKIERRYTDFCYLHAALKKLNFVTLDEIPFPERILLGNFQYNNIYKRSRSFEVYLRQLSTVSEIANSPTFLHFLHGPELRQCLTLIQQRNYVPCTQALHNLANVQSFLFKTNDPKLVTTMATICVVSSLAKDYKDSWSAAIYVFNLFVSSKRENKPNYPARSPDAKLIFESLLGNDDNVFKSLIDQQPLFLPLIHMLSDLAWVMGHNKEPIQNILHRIKRMEEQGSTEPKNIDPKADILKYFVTQATDYLSLI